MNCHEISSEILNYVVPWWRHDKKLFSRGIGILCKARNILISIREKFCTRYAFLFLGWHYCMRHGETHLIYHDDVIKWKHFPRNWPFVRGIHRFPVNSQHKGQWRGALMFTLICARINGWVNNREAGDLRRYRPHYDVIVMHLDPLENMIKRISIFDFKIQKNDWYSSFVRKPGNTYPKTVRVFHSDIHV